VHKSNRWAFAASGLIGLVVWSGSPSFAQERIGAAAAISNRVEGTVAGNATALAVGSDVFLNELVSTGDDGVARLVFLDNTNLSVGPGSRVTLDRFVYNPGRGAGSVVVRASAGAFRFVTGSQRPQNYLIQTPIATIGVRGTIFDLYVQADRIIVTLISGQIRVTTLQGRVVPVTRPGDSVTIYAAGTVVRRADWSGIVQPNFAALFGQVQVSERTETPPTRLTSRRVAPPSEISTSLRPGRVSLGLTVGGGVIAGLPTDSSSGFYSGNLDSAAVGFLVGGQGFVDVAQFGQSPRPFESSVLSIGLIADYVGSASLTWNGRCGGVPCDGAGHLNELNVLAAAKLTTPISASDTANAYVGVGIAAMWPTGTPTGPGGPAFVGSDVAPAVRIGVGFDHRLNDALSIGLTGGVQFTGATEYDTTLAGERFRLNSKTEGIFGVTLTYSPP
jgi:hypothetical protein